MNGELDAHAETEDFVLKYPEKRGKSFDDKPSGLSQNEIQNRTTELLGFSIADFKRQVGLEDTRVLAHLFNLLLNNLKNSQQKKAKLEAYVRLQMIAPYMGEDEKLALSELSTKEYAELLAPENESTLLELLSNEESRAFVPNLFKKAYEAHVNSSKQSLLNADTQLSVEVADAFLGFAVNIENFLAIPSVKSQVNSPSLFTLSQDKNRFDLIKKACLATVDIVVPTSVASTVSELKLLVEQLSVVFNQRALVFSESESHLLEQFAGGSRIVSERLSRFRLIKKMASFLSELNQSLQIGDPELLSRISSTRELPQVMLSAIQPMLIPLQEWLKHYYAVKQRSQGYILEAVGSKSELQVEISSIRQMLGRNVDFPFEAELLRVGQVRANVDTLFDSVSTHESLIELWMQREKYKALYANDPYFIRRYQSFLEDLAAKANGQEVSLREFDIRNEIRRVIGSEEYAYNASTIQAEVKRNLEQKQDFEEFTNVLDTQLAQAADYLHRGINTYDVIADVLEVKFEGLPFNIERSIKIREIYFKILVKNQHPRISEIITAWFAQGGAIELDMLNGVGQQNLLRILDGHHQQLSGYFRSESLPSCLQSIRLFNRLNSAGYDASSQAILVARQIVQQKLEQIWNVHMGAGEYATVAIQLQQLRSFSEEIEECNPKFMTEMQKYLNTVDEFDRSVAQVFSIVELSGESMQMLHNRLQTLEQLMDNTISEVPLSKLPPLDSVVAARQAFDSLQRLPLELQSVIDVYKATASLDAVNEGLQDFVILWMSHQQTEKSFRTIGIDIKLRQFLAKLINQHPFVKVDGNGLRLVSATEVMVSELGKQVERARSSAALLATERDILEKRLVELPTELRTLQLEITRQQAQLEALIEQKAQSAQAIDALKSELAEVEREQIQIQNELHGIQKNAEVSKRQLTQVSEDSADQIREIDVLKTRNHALETEKNAVLNEVNRYTREIEKLKAELHTLESNRTTLQSEERALRNLVEAAKTDIELYEGNLRRNTAVVYEKRAEVEEQAQNLDALQKRANALYDQLEVQAKILQHLEEQKAESVQQQRSALDTIAIMQTENNGLKEEIARLQDAQTELGHLKKVGEANLVSTVDGLPANQVLPEAVNSFENIEDTRKTEQESVSAREIVAEMQKYTGQDRVKLLCTLLLWLDDHSEEQNTFDWYVKWLHVRALSTRVQFSSEDDLSARLQAVLRSQISTTNWHSVSDLQMVEAKDRDLKTLADVVHVYRRERFKELLLDSVAAINTASDPLRLHDEVSQYKASEEALWLEFLRDNEQLRAAVHVLKNEWMRIRFNWVNIESLRRLSNRELDQKLFHTAYEIARILVATNYGNLALDYLRAVLNSPDVDEARAAAHLLTLEERELSSTIAQMSTLLKREDLSVDEAFRALELFCYRNKKAVSEQVIKALYDTIDSEITHRKKNKNKKDLDRVAILHDLRKKLQVFFDNYSVSDI